MMDIQTLEHISPGFAFGFAGDFRGEQIEHADYQVGRSKAARNGDTIPDVRSDSPTRAFGVLKVLGNVSQTHG